MASNADPAIPSFVVDSETKIDMVIEQTQAQVTTQQTTYNQPGYTYNQPGWMYGGIYENNQDEAPVFANDTAVSVSPIIASVVNGDSPVFTNDNASLLSPSISSIIDIYTPKPAPPPANSGMLMGILGLTYP